MTGRRRSIIVLALLASCILPIYSAVASETVAYTYDALGRLVKVGRSGSINNGVSACYNYDEAANRANVTAATAADCATGASPPSFAVNDAVVLEGGSLVFVVTKTGAASSSFSVNYATSNGTATSGSDYTTTSGTLTFEPGQVSKQISVPTAFASSLEATETLNFTLSSPTGSATITDASGLGTITDNGTPPSFSISDAVAVVEGGGLAFTVTKNSASSVSFEVNYATADGTAVEGTDYNAASGTLTFTGSDTTKSITVTTIDDAAIENAKTVQVNLSGATGGSTIADGQGVGSMTDNENYPPVANTDTLSVQTCHTGSKNVIANDTDPEGNTPLTLIEATNPLTHGYASVLNGTTVQFEANDFPGTETVTYVVMDSKGVMGSGTLSVQVTSGVCDGPEF